MTEPTETQINALRRTGGLPAYLRTLIRPTRRTPTTRGDPDPRHTPGAWPHGTHPTNSATCRPDCPCNPGPPPTA